MNEYEEWHNKKSHQESLIKKYRNDFHFWPRWNTRKNMFTLPSGIREKQTNMWNNSLQGTGHEAMKDNDAWEMSLSIIPDDPWNGFQTTAQRAVQEEETEMRTYKEHCS